MKRIESDIRACIFNYYYDSWKYRIDAGEKYDAVAVECKVAAENMLSKYRSALETHYAQKYAVEGDDELKDALHDLSISVGQDEETGEYIYSFEVSELADFIAVERNRAIAEGELNVWRRLSTGDGLSAHDGCFEIHPDYIDEEIGTLEAQLKKEGTQ
tara:strand:- start:220 stop:693 length:474 start_codon:yes stop_codon:yes gene_type:complete